MIQGPWIQGLVRGENPSRVMKSAQMQCTQIKREKFLVGCSGAELLLLASAPETPEKNAISKFRPKCLHRVRTDLMSADTTFGTCLF